MQSLTSYMNRYSDSKYVFKSCGKEWIVILQKLSDTITNEARKVVDAKFAKFRADKLLVVDIVNKFDQTKSCISIYNSIYVDDKIEYAKGKTIEITNFDKNIHKVCTRGIHYFKTIVAAFYCELDKVTNGEWIQWYDSGRLQIKGMYINGIKEGEWIKWHNNGSIQIKGLYKNGKREGRWTEWYEHDGLIKWTFCWTKSEEKDD